MIHTRRKVLVGLGSLLAAPAIVHAGNLMPVKALRSLLVPYGRSPAMDCLPDLVELRLHISSIMWIDLEHAGFPPDLVAKFIPPSLKI